MKELEKVKVGFGKFKDVYWSRVPVGYVRYVANFYTGSRQAIAFCELERRGTKIVLPDIEITHHAIDRASEKLIDVWQKDKLAGEGLASWLLRKSDEALKQGKESEGKYEYQGMKFVFKFGYICPSLATVYPIVDNYHGKGSNKA